MINEDKIYRFEKSLHNNVIIETIQFISMINLKTGYMNVKLFRLHAILYNIRHIQIAKKDNERCLGMCTSHFLKLHM